MRVSQEDDKVWHFVKYGLAFVFGIFGTLSVVAAVAALTSATIPDLVYASGGRYETAPAANRAEGYVFVSGSTCFAEGVEEAVVRVGIRWQWVDNEPEEFSPFYNEDGGSTPYGPDRLPLDPHGCFEFENFKQQMPPQLRADLASDPSFGGWMEIIFTLTPTDLTRGEQVAGTSAFAFAGPFLIPPATGDNQ